MTDTDFLYPFIEGDERDADALLVDLATSARAKIDESEGLRAETRAGCAEELERAARAMADAFRVGGRLFTFGNGGSATDARLAAERFGRADGDAPALPAMCLAEAPAVVTALANDVGFAVVFARQLEALGRRGDVALGCSTSGGSQNVLRAFAVARAAGLVTVGLAGYDGGAMAADGHIDHCLVVRSQSVHRIQEAQAALVADLCASVHRALTEVPTR
jgi:D-sedoheptulose 7-phosphate isomerase